jgi:PAS domain S-box-containing protein
VEHPTRYVGTLQDITAQHEGIEALRASEARLSLAIDAGRMAVWVYDFASNTLQGSPELNRLYGLPPEAEPTIEEFRSRYYADDRQRVTNAYQNAAEQNERFFEVEYRCVHPDHSVRWLLLRAENEVNAAGEPSRIVGVVLDITARKEAEEHRELLINELNHRVKNTLATVQSITRQTLRAASSTEQANEDIEHRLIALARAHNVLTRESWGGASLREIVCEAVAAHVDEAGGRLRLDGPVLWLEPQTALALAMGVAELGTNAVKYGALSNDVGIVHVSWCVEDVQASRLLSLVWRERGGPMVQPPSRRGFGTRLIEVSLARELGGQVQIAFEPQGVTCRFLVPIASGAAHAA